MKKFLLAPLSVEVEGATAIYLQEKVFLKISQY